ncbi:MAG: low molecular weight protein-tyrosine-phosphatase [Litorimonas sp.]
MTSILFVCLGNICRSPSAEAVLRYKARMMGFEAHIDSAGTGGWHEGEPPDPRAQAAGEVRGYNFKGQSARAVRNDDFVIFDHILAMDSHNYDDLIARCPAQYRFKIRKFLALIPDNALEDVPDPYYGGANGFEHVLDLIEAASEALLHEIA